MTGTECVAMMPQRAMVQTSLPNRTPLFRGRGILPRGLLGELDLLAILVDLLLDLIDSLAVLLLSLLPTNAEGLFQQDEGTVRLLVGGGRLLLLIEELRIGICDDHTHFLCVDRLGLNKCNE